MGRATTKAMAERVMTSSLTEEDLTQFDKETIDDAILNGSTPSTTSNSQASFFDYNKALEEISEIAEDQQSTMGTMQGVASEACREALEKNLPCR